MLRPRPILAVAALVGALCPRAGWASPEDLFGYGPRPGAMGGLGGAVSDDFSSVHSNPAGLSRASALAFTVGYQGAGFGLSTRRAGQPPEHPAQDVSRGTVIGLALPRPVACPFYPSDAAAD